MLLLTRREMHERKSVREVRVMDCMVFFGGYVEGVFGGEFIHSVQNKNTKKG